MGATWSLVSNLIYVTPASTADQQCGEGDAAKGPAHAPAPSAHARPRSRRLGDDRVPGLPGAVAGATPRAPVPAQHDVPHHR